MSNSDSLKLKLVDFKFKNSNNEIQRIKSLSREDELNLNSLLLKLHKDGITQIQTSILD